MSLRALLLFFAAMPAAAQIHQPPAPRTMWDTWVYQHDGVFDLFFLQSDPGKTWNTIGRAVSRDLVHWQTLPAIESKGPAGAWDHEPTLTGITVKHDGRYVMFYGGATKTEQRIGLMFSPDLKQWTKYEANPILIARPPHYGGADWRDLFTWQDAATGLWHAVTCARTADGKSAIGHLTSKDLIHWDYLPPLFVDASFSDMEVPEPFEMNGKHYLLFSNIRSPKTMSGRKDAVGSYYAMADRAEGPYRVTPESLLLGSGNKRFDVYVGRTLNVGGEKLLYSQTVGGNTTWSTPKVIRQRADGSLWLAYWKGLDTLATGLVYTAKSPRAGLQPVRVTDAMITVTANVKSTATVSWREKCSVTLDAAAHVVRIAQEGFPMDEIAVKEMTPGRHHLRLLLRAGRAEVYMDNRWLFNYRVRGPQAAGNVVLSGDARFHDLRVEAIEPMDALVR